MHRLFEALDAERIVFAAGMLVITAASAGLVYVLVDYFNVRFQ